MELRHLEYFLRIAESGSFSLAAASLNLTQPTLSRQITQLEDELQQRLFERTGRGVKVTEAGRVLLEHARHMLQLAQQTKDEMQNLAASPIGRIAVGLPPRISFAVSSTIVERFRERMPRAALSISEGLSVNLKEWLVAGRLDVALLFDPPSTPSLMFELLLEEPLVLVGKAGARALPKSVSLQGLCDFPLVLPSAPSSIRSVVDDRLEPLGLRPNVIVEVGGVSTVLKLVAQGVGFSLLPTSLLHTAGAGLDICHAPLEPPGLSNKMFLAIPRAGATSRLFVETLSLLREIDYTGGDLLRGDVSRPQHAAV